MPPLRPCYSFYSHTHSLSLPILYLWQLPQQDKAFGFREDREGTPRACAIARQWREASGTEVGACLHTPKLHCGTDLCSPITYRITVGDLARTELLHCRLDIERADIEFIAQN